ncbi:hypothetical protein B4U79_11076 [Dinothrombium tinctorium]|uniref:Uncharacterized protein n=1 Tax=Dinothrombium tinctorium TaxID=1965070 RepID=A0A443QMS8_9ACAR|nr:hypothetical protein B4U79_11076 [Dinothrombium tinctorium]
MKIAKMSFRRYIKQCLNITRRNSSHSLCVK